MFSLFSTILGLILLQMIYASNSIEGKVSTREFNTNQYVNSPIKQTLQQVKISLNSGQMTTEITSDGKFILNNIPEGKYIMTVESRLFEFPKYMVEVTNKATQIFRLFDGNIRQIVEQPLQIVALHSITYFEIVPEFTIGSIFRNTYFIPIGLTAVMFLLLKCLPNIEDAQAELQKQQQQQKLQSQQRTRN